MQVLTRVEEVTQRVIDVKRSGKRIAVVPTMGALHEGHLSLVDRAADSADFVIVTIFVNPAQFSPTEDLSKYPRTLEGDLQKLRQRNVGMVFVPGENEIYPRGFSTVVDPPEIARSLEGTFRPTHFRGVTTVVLKLLNIARADVAVFGQKDFQQAAVIRRMVIDLNVPCQIIVAPIARDPDGLAMSSRNRYLSPDDRNRALAIRRSLLKARASILNLPGQPSAKISQLVRDELTAAGIQEIDYAVAVDPETFEPQSVVAAPVAILIAVRVGTTRLIDNELIEASE
ncbi:MAG: pantoate--beta-alanine ligase [Pirellulaceae bacterium]